VAGIGRGQRKLLEEAGIGTLTALGQLHLSLAERPKKLRRDSLERIRHQARLQLVASPRLLEAPCKAPRHCGW
jgi:hypothetical protein